MSQSRWVLVFVVVLAGLSAYGCNRQWLESSHVVTGQQHAPVAPEQVTIYMEGQDPPPGYHEVAIVEGRGNHRVAMPGVLERLKQDAAAMGANALINIRVDQGGTIISVTGVAVRY
ncbi:MAG: hypothetical protein KC593_08105 [Myxococcales bacterium]|nr:hypothetical protein [Myxococcales bacterium]MCB9630351.1 hypothetical protein [Sandaracinaceae bacterium]